MMQMAQPGFPPHGGMAPGHPGMQHGHPMAGMQHPGGGHMGGQPGPGMMPGMHPGVSGPQVTQPMVTGMPTGPGTPAPGGQMQNAHAMAHLGPGQQPMFQQHNPQMNIGQMPNFQQQQIMQARQRQMHQMMQAQQQQHGMPVNMPAGMNFNPAQMAQLKAGMPMPMQQQMQMQQQAAANQQAAAAQNYQNQRIMQAHHQAQAQQQAAMQAQQQRAAAQQMQLSRSNEASTQPPQSQPTPAPQNAVQAQAAPTPKPQPQQTQPNPPQGQTSNPPQPQSIPARPQQGEQLQNQEETDITQQDAGEEMVMPQPLKAPDFTGRLILHLLHFQDRLKNVERPQDIAHWEDFVQTFFSPLGSVRLQVYNKSTKIGKHFKIEYASLARFYHAHFACGVQKIEMSSSDCREADLGNGCHHVWSSHSTFTYTFQNGIKVTTNGTVQVNFDAMNKMEHLSINTVDWQEYLPRQILQVPESPDQKQDTKINKNMKKSQAKAAPIVSSPPLPTTPVGIVGLPNYMVQFLEIAEVMSQMGPLFEYFQTHPGITPRDALHQIVQENTRKFNQTAQAMNGGIPPQRNPGINGPMAFQSPALGHLGLPQGQGSPHIGGSVHTPSPAQNHVGGVGMMHQMSQQGSNLSGSQGPSTNTSPNVSNKRRRASAIKLEDENSSQDVNGAGSNKVKPSPQISKRQKGAK